jgi:hypothetical protein
MQLSFHEGVGDHRMTLVDVATRSVIGKFKRRVVTTQARKLAAKNKKSIKEYINYVTQQCQPQKLHQRLDDLMETAHFRTVLPIHQEEMEQVDTQKRSFRRVARGNAESLEDLYSHQSTDTRDRPQATSIR